MFRKLKKIQYSDSSSDSYLSISDLMSSVVLILCLALVVFMFQFSQAEIEIEKQKQEIEEQKKIIIEFAQKIEEIEKEFKKIQGLTGNAITKINDDLKKAGVNVSQDPLTNNLIIESEFTFERAKSTLSDKGIKYLNKFILEYAKAIFENKEPKDSIKFSDLIDYILVIGNTSRMGDDAANMNLSLMRAKSIFDFIDQHEEFPYKNELIQKLHFTGRGELDSKNPNGSDDPNDRHIVFKFIFKRDKIDELMNKLNEIFNGVKQFKKDNNIK